MKTSEIDKLRNQAAKWPHFVRDWNDIPVDASSIVVNPKHAKSLEPLVRFKRLKHLIVLNSLRERDTPHIAELAGLRTLLVEY